MSSGTSVSGWGLLIQSKAVLTHYSKDLTYPLQSPLPLHWALFLMLSYWAFLIGTQGLSLLSVISVSTVIGKSGPLYLVSPLHWVLFHESVWTDQWPWVTLWRWWDKNTSTSLSPWRHWYSSNSSLNLLVVGQDDGGKKSLHVSLSFPCFPGHCCCGFCPAVTVKHKQSSQL